MEFIEPKINPNSTLKYAVIEIERSSQNMKQKRNKKTEKTRNYAALTRHHLARSCHFASRSVVQVSGCTAVRLNARLCLASFSSILLFLVLGTSLIL